MINGPASSVEDLKRWNKLDMVPWDSVPVEFHQTGYFLFVKKLPEDLEECGERFRLTRRATYTKLNNSCGILKDKGFTNGHRVYVLPSK